MTLIRVFGQFKNGFGRKKSTIRQFCFEHAKIYRILVKLLQFCAKFGGKEKKSPESGRSAQDKTRQDQNRKGKTKNTVLCAALDHTMVKIPGVFPLFYVRTIEPCFHALQLC
jgi:hypothetical protein